VFLGYNNQHNGYKCVEPSTGRVYISRDVIFDETVFPFSTLHANASAQLKSELLLLHPTLCSQHGDDRVEVSDVANAADSLLESSYAVPGLSGEEGADNSLEQVAMDPADAGNLGTNPGVDSPMLSTVDLGRIRSPLESAGVGTSGIASTPIRTEQEPWLPGELGSFAGPAAP
jgi:hypothetical protein